MEPFSTNGTPEAVQTVAVSDIYTPLCSLATTSPSLCLREILPIQNLDFACFARRNH